MGIIRDTITIATDAIKFTSYALKTVLIGDEDGRGILNAEFMPLGIAQSAIEMGVEYFNGYRNLKELEKIVKQAGYIVDNWEVNDSYGQKKWDEKKERVFGGERRSIYKVIKSSEVKSKEYYVQKYMDTFKEGYSSILQKQYDKLDVLVRHAKDRNFVFDENETDGRAFYEMVKEATPIVESAMIINELAPVLNEHLSNIKNIDSVDEWKSSKDVKKVEKVLDEVMPTWKKDILEISNWDSMDGQVEKFCFDNYDNIKEAFYDLEDEIFNKGLNQSSILFAVDALKQIAEKEKDVYMDYD